MVRRIMWIGLPLCASIAVGGVVPAANPKEALQGLQSLTRVQLKLPDAVKNMRAEVIKQFRERLPQLNTEGSSDDWALEVVFSTVFMPDTTISDGSGPMVPVTSCHWRLSRPAVVDGRSVTAVAFDGAASMGRTPIRLGGRFGPSNLNAENDDLVLKAIAKFSEAWRKANPDVKQK